jgi:Skp family chaperone for outer membrane proteins
MHKRTFFIAALMAAAALSAQAQQLTRFAVIDLPKLYTVFYQDSKVVRDGRNGAVVSSRILTA